MKSIRKNLKVISLFMSFLMLFISCEQYDNTIENSTVSEYNGEELFKSIFFGLGSFSKNVPLLNKVSESIQNLDDTKKKEFESNVDSLLTEIKRISPNFLSSFESKIKSSNHHIIELAIQEGILEVRSSIEVIVPDFKKVMLRVESDIKSGELEFNNSKDIEKYVTEFKNTEYDELLKKNMITDDVAACSLFLVCAVAIVVILYAAVAAHNTVAIAANIYLVFSLWGPRLGKYRGGGGGLAQPYDGPSPLLEQEMMVDQIAGIQWEF